MERFSSSFRYTFAISLLSCCINDQKLFPISFPVQSSNPHGILCTCNQKKITYKKDSAYTAESCRIGVSISVIITY